MKKTRRDTTSYRTRNATSLDGASGACLRDIVIQIRPSFLSVESKIKQLILRILISQYKQFFLTCTHLKNITVSNEDSIKRLENYENSVK